MEYDDHPITRHLDVDLEISKPVGNGALEGDHRVLRPENATASMGEPHRMLEREIGMSHAASTTAPPLMTVPMSSESGR